MHIGISRIPGRKAALALVALGALALGAPAALASGGGTLTLGPQKDVGKKPAIVNGTPISITSTPWQVFVQAEDTVNRFVYNCGGSIYDATTIITAGHCVYNVRTGLPFTPVDMTVVAGISNTDPATPRGADQDPQVGVVSGIRIHPGYSYTAENGGVAPDDIAVLTLATPLDLSTPTAKAIPLAAAGPNPVLGTSANITGYGLQAAGGTPDGRLYGVGTTIGDPLVCGGEANAVVLCITSQVGSACEGDSGGPLTIGALLSGVASFVSTNGPTGECGVGSVNGYTNLAAPEIQEFVQGNNAPPIAPRGGGDVSATGVFQAGNSMTCSAGTWSGAPTYAYAFVDTRNGQVLQVGPSPTYAFTDGDVGRTVACEASATNAGGTGITRTQASPAIAARPAPPAPTPPAPTPTRPTPRRPTPRAPAAKPSLSVGVTAASTNVVRGRTVAYSIRVVNRGRAAAKGVVVCDAPGRGLSFGTLPRGAKKSRGRACWSLGTVKARSSRTLRVTLRVAGSTKPGLVTNAVSLRSSNGGNRADTVRVRVRAAQQRGTTRPPAVTG
ncbi:trypsin-like serine protease [Conexibacter sp. CPCC 206217]|uniref:trypsin-like serine protease n=1 Tax=Conexibacter sp. CPCC 206217 TaxID=3064574 RepID=UPI00271B029C|nr:trypsin-like serine protease [Conexibacter sp. CPCC 206217]MDO8213949.1 trypsin-like serine protease [Conexibacter sp. CPCC 206217]